MTLTGGPLDGHVVSPSALSGDVLKLRFATYDITFGENLDVKQVVVVGMVGRYSKLVTYRLVAGRLLYAPQENNAECGK